MAVLHSDPARMEEYIRELKEAEDLRVRERRNLAQRARRRGVSAKVQEQREWIKANPCGFEVR